MEYNDQTNKNGKYNKNSNLVNSTTYQFFLENGTILDYHICKGINVTTEKRVETNRINIKEVKLIDKKYNISIFNKTEEIFNDYCIPFNIYSKDLTLYDRQLLISKYKIPCDESCTFHSFNYVTNYSTCYCPIKFEDDLDIKDIILEEINESNYIKLIKNSNYKYFLCYKSITKIFENEFVNWFGYISISFFFSNFILLCGKKLSSEYNSKQNEKNHNRNNLNERIQNNINEHKKRNRIFNKIGNNRKELNNINNINLDTSRILNSLNINNNNNNKNCCDKILSFYQIKIKNKFYYLIVINITLHTLFFLNAFLFSDKYIIKRNIYLIKNSDIIYILTREYDRLIYSYIITFILVNILKWLLDPESQEEGNEVLFKVLKPLKKCLYCISIFIIICLHFTYSIFFIIFGKINPYSQVPIILSTIITLVLHVVFYSLICLMISLQKCCNNDDNWCYNLCELIKIKCL